MQQQLSFVQAKYAAKKRVTGRERFVTEAVQVVPRGRLLEVLAPHDYPNAHPGAGRPPIGPERMLRMYLNLGERMWV